MKMTLKVWPQSKTAILLYYFLSFPFEIWNYLQQVEFFALPLMGLEFFFWGWPWVFWKRTKSHPLVSVLSNFYYLPCENVWFGGCRVRPGEDGELSDRGRRGHPVRGSPLASGPHQTELLEQEDQLWGRPHLKPVGHHGGTLRLQHSPGTHAHQAGGVERQGTKRKAPPWRLQGKTRLSFSLTFFNDVLKGFSNWKNSRDQKLKPKIYFLAYL